MPTVAETIKKISSFAELPIGWHFGEGVSSFPENIEEATKLLRFAGFLGVTRTNAFPGINGQVQVTFYHKDLMLELTLESDGFVTIAEDESDTQVVFREGAPKIEAYAKLIEFSQKVWDSSESFIVDTTTQNAATFLVRHLSRLATKVSPLSRLTVPFSLARRSANTLSGFTQTRLETPQFTGGFQTIKYRRAAGSSKSEVLPAMIATSIFTVGVETAHVKRSSH